MAYVRGNRSDFDEWAGLGNSGWSYEDVLPFFKRSEHNEDLNDAFHGKGGPLNVSFAKSFQTPFASAFVAGCQELGIPRNEDYNGEKQEGCGFFQFTIKDGKRHSTASAFLKPALSRKNLHVFTHSLVSQILIEKDRAVGVEISKGKGASQKVFARKEVILCAGAFQSPQLLMLSGIGEPEELKRAGIDVKLALPGVGKNLQDHLFFPVSALANVQEGFNHHLSPFNQVKDLIGYLLTHRGVLTCSPLEAVAFYHSQGKAGVDFQLHFAPIHLGDRYDTDMYDLTTYPRTDGFTILPSLLKPKSIGYVGLRSADFRENPVIQPNFLSAEEDLYTLIAGAKKGLEILKSDAFGPYRKKIITPPQESDEELANHIRKSVETIYHPVGTCKMGHDPDSVVNHRLKVHGIDGLRVADASIMPKIVAGNTNAAVIMIGEKVADLILNG
jgi:choline dehydrogenase